MPPPWPYSFVLGCRGCTAEIDGPQRKSIIEGEDEYNACIAALKTWNTRYTGPAGF